MITLSEQSQIADRFDAIYIKLLLNKEKTYQQAEAEYLEELTLCKLAGREPPKTNGMLSGMANEIVNMSCCIEELRGEINYLKTRIVDFQAKFRSTGSLFEDAYTTMPRQSYKGYSSTNHILDSNDINMHISNINRLS